MCERFSRVSDAARCAAALGLSALLLNPGLAAAQPPAPTASGGLGGAESFVVLARTLVSNAGASTLAGDVGALVEDGVQGVTAAMLTPGSRVHEGDAVAAQAFHSASGAYADLAARACPAANRNPVLSGGSLASGVYCFDGDAVLNGTLTLTGTGPWTFQVAGGLVVGPGASVVAPLAAPSTCRGTTVFWQVGDDDPLTALAPTSIGTGATFIGNLLAQGDVTVGAGAAIDGRIFSLGNAGGTDGGEVALNASQVAACSYGNPLPTAAPFTVTGGGGINVPTDPAETDPEATGTGFANYGFNARPGVDGASATGTFNYVNHVRAARLHVNGPVTDADVLALNDDGTPRTVRFSGTCDAFLPACTFSVMVEDHGQPPVNDQFGVTFVSGSTVVEARSMRRVRNGNIRFHTATLTTEVESSTVRPGQTMRLSARLRRDRTATPADAYVVLRLPDGQMLSWTGSTLVPGLVPLVRNFVPVDFIGEILQLRVPPGTPAGTYTWMSGLTEAGTLNLLSGISERRVTVSP